MHWCTCNINHAQWLAVRYNYSTNILFLHQSIGLPVPCCTNTMDKTSKHKPSTSMTPWLANQRCVQLWSHPCIHAQETGWQLGVRSFSLPALSTHFMQESNVRTVPVSHCTSIFKFEFERTKTLWRNELFYDLWIIHHLFH